MDTAKPFSYLTLIKFPPYSPEFNPIEQVWPWLRQRCLSNRAYKHISQLSKQLLASGYLDMISGVPVIPNNMRCFTLSTPYSQQAIAMIVKGKHHAEFTDQQTSLTINYWC